MPRSRRDVGSAEDPQGPSRSTGSGAGVDSDRGFVGRYGPVLLAAGITPWPHAFLLEGSDGLPHWQRLGLDRNELLFVLAVLGSYDVRGQWPIVANERMARALGLDERSVRRIKKDLIDSQYLRRLPRHAPYGTSLPDALDLAPLFALLEACVLRYHASLVTRAVWPEWIRMRPSNVPLDPDEVGRSRRDQSEQSVSWHLSLATALSAETGSTKVDAPDSPNERSFAGRFGPVLVSAGINLWPSTLLLETGDGVPHWRTLGLERHELLFLIVTLSAYHARESWPAIANERLARMLGLDERWVRRIKKALIDNRYVKRVVRRSTDGTSLPDALDLSPVLALLEACVLRDHSDVVNRATTPVWLAKTLLGDPIDPDEFGRSRANRHRDYADTTVRSIDHPSADGEVIHSLGEGDIETPLGGAHKPPSSGTSTPTSRGQLDPPPKDSRALRSEDLFQIAPDGSLDQREIEENHRARAPGLPSVLQKSDDREQRDPLPYKSDATSLIVTALIDDYARRFRDNSPDDSIRTAHHLWWNSGLSHDKFVNLINEAVDITKATISSGRVRKGQPGQRQAMPYFFRVLRTLCADAGVSEMAV
jgi:hypothetical protein